VHGTLSPTQFVWTSNGVERKFAPSEIVHFGGYDPTNPLTGLSPLETLRRVLAEEAASSAYREAFWTNAARIDGVISRPAPPAAPKWTPDQKQSFREQWTAMHTGALNAGRTAVLEDGMTFTAAAHSAKDSEYLESRKLAREECAAAYHIPLPMVGILEHATFSNIREQHKHLYQDCLGPWLVMIEEEIERQVLPEFSDVQRVYVEFNIAEKLKGSFEEQAAALQSLVGAPVMTRNEGRSRLNLRSMPDKAADELVTPLNMIGSADAPPAPADESETAVDVAPIIRGAWQRQESRLARVPVADRPAAFLSMSHRWTRELEADLLPLVGDKDEARRLAADANAATLDRLHDEARTHG
jgi:HK97 family phage portal protein